MEHKQGRSLWSAFRDFSVSALPLRKVPSFLLKCLYGSEPSFVFLTHPRNPEDIYRSFPLLRKVRWFVPENFLFHLLSLCPAYVVARVKTKEGLEGIFVSTSLSPKELFGQRRRMLNHVARILSFIRKITSGRVYVGLAAWWPMVTDNGLALKRFLREDDRLVITNGHTSTLASIVLSVEKLCRLVKLPTKELKLLVIGVGKMGGVVAEAFYGKVSLLGLVDQNPIRLERFEARLKEKIPASMTEKLVVSETDFSSRVVPALAKYHMAVCTTSNIGYVIRNSEILKDCIILDDARPEAFPRIVNTDRNVAVLEGGLIRIKGIKMDADFGFGREENVFGCLAEAFILNLDRLQTLKPTLGEVDLDNFWKFLEFCRTHGIGEGEFKSGHSKVEEATLKKMLEAKMSSFS